MTPIAFVDTETTSLRHDRRAWDVAVIIRRDGGADARHQWFIDADDLDLGNADPMALKIGRFHQRHPQYQMDREAKWAECHDEAGAMREIEAITRDAHIVGCVPNFDTEVLGNRMRAHGICPSWHYHLIDCENLAVGYLRSSSAFGASQDGTLRELAGSITSLPWDSEALSRALGIDPDQFDRHTAMGDARWAMAIFDAICPAAKS